MSPLGEIASVVFYLLCFFALRQASRRQIAEIQEKQKADRQELDALKLTVKNWDELLKKMARYHERKA